MKTRIITGVLGLIIAIICISLGGIFFNGACAILALCGWYEYSQIIKRVRIKTAVYWGFIFIFLLLVTVSMKMYAFSVALAIFAFFLLSLLYIMGNRSVNNLHTIMYSAFGFSYIVGAFVSLILLRDNGTYSWLQLPFSGDGIGIIITWLIMFSTWASDTFAYFAGLVYGKRHIVPNISPNKTLEGYVGGFIGCIVTGIVYAFITGIPLHMGFEVGLLIGIFAPIGDLFESKLKRTCAIKDSGKLLPGHGGVLDRFDSLLFVAPVVFIYLLQY